MWRPSMPPQIAIALLLIHLCSIPCESFSTTTAMLRPMRPSAYLSLRTCVGNSSLSSSTSCFTTAPAPIPPLSNGAPPVLLVPGCAESLLELCTPSACIPHFPSTGATPSSARLLRVHPPRSAAAVESFLPPRRLPGGPYSALSAALFARGYSDGASLSALPWDWRRRDGAISATARLRAVLAASKEPTVVVARGAGCAVAAAAVRAMAGRPAVATTRSVRAVLCLAPPRDGRPRFEMMETELGLRERRRGRPLPVVDGPWGDGRGGSDCRAEVEMVKVDMGEMHGVPVVCCGDCGRWIDGARNVEVEDGEDDVFLAQIGRMMAVVG